MYVLTPGTRVRFFSYIGADYILGAEPDKNGWPRTALKHVATDSDAGTTFTVVAAERDCFRLKWGRSLQGYNDVYLKWAPNYQQLTMTVAPIEYTAPGNLQDWIDKGLSPQCYATLFRVDPVKDGNWFALNDRTRQAVVDIDHGSGARNTKIFAWPWNGGDNQIWRTEAV